MNPQDRFPIISEWLHGKPTDKTIAMIDLWGTTAKIDKYVGSGDLLDIGNVIQIQSRFSSVLAVIAQNNPKFEVIQASDGAFIVADDVSALLDQVQMMFVYLSQSAGSFQFIPLRAALSKGLQGITNLVTLPNFQCLPYIGPAFVKVYKMEKSWPKGMRIFITEEVKASLNSQSSFMVAPEPVSNVKVIKFGDEPYYEVNWLGQPGPNNLQIIRTNVGAEFLKLANLWVEKGDPYQKSIGNSILEYGIWAQDQYEKPKMTLIEKIKLWAIRKLFR